MLSAYGDIGVKRSSTRRSNSEPRIARPPQTSGSSAATTLRKITSASRKRIGNAISSARLRSFCTWSLTCTVAIAAPPTAVPGTVSMRRATRLAASRQRRCETPARAYPGTIASLPSRDRTGPVTTGKSGSERISPATRATRARDGSRTRTSTCGPGESREARSTSASARRLSLPSATNSFEARPSLPGVDRPRAAASTASAPTTASTRRGARMTRRASQSTMAVCCAAAVLLPRYRRAGFGALCPRR